MARNIKQKRLQKTEEKEIKKQSENINDRNIVENKTKRENEKKTLVS